MPVGFQIFDASGRLTLDLADRIGRIVSSVSTGTANGSISNSELSNGTPFGIVIPQGLGRFNDQYNRGAFPSIYFAGATMYWTFPTWAINAGVLIPCTIFFGVY